MFLLHVLPSFSKVTDFLSLPHDNMNHSMETLYHLVCHKGLKSLQHSHYFTTHGSLILLCMFTLRILPVFLITFTLCRHWRSQSLLYTLQTSVRLFKQYCCELRSPIYLLAYNMHLEYFYERESCSMEATQFKAPAINICSQSDLTSWLSMFGFQL